jgi:hypothetical protein
MSKESPAGMDRTSSVALQRLAIAMAVGGAAVVIYALQVNSFLDFARVAMVGLLVGGAALMVGGLLGFLFGIPHTSGVSDQTSQPSAGQSLQPANLPNQPSIGQGPQPVSPSPRASIQPNTNLEQISDWLTKILVGVGLTQLTVIPDKIGHLAAYIAKGLSGTTGPETFSLAVMIYFSVIGFLFGFLWTRLNLGHAMAEADMRAILNRVVAQAANTTKTQAEADAQALALADSQLHPGLHQAPPKPDEAAKVQTELITAFKAASPSARMTIFSQARSQRRDNWLIAKDKVDLSVPIFRALIEAEATNHRYHGQLGYALKDQTTPDWAAAEIELTKAIELRDKDPNDRYGYPYDFNRGLCRIKLGMTREKILPDLTATVKQGQQEYITNSPDILTWLEANGLSVEKLG